MDRWPLCCACSCIGFGFELALTSPSEPWTIKFGLIFNPLRLYGSRFCSVVFLHSALAHCLLVRAMFDYSHVSLLIALNAIQSLCACASHLSFASDFSICSSVCVCARRFRIYLWKLFQLHASGFFLLFYCCRLCSLSSSTLPLSCSLARPLFFAFSFRACFITVYVISKFADRRWRRTGKWMAAVATRRVRERERRRKKYETYEKANIKSMFGKKGRSQRERERWRDGEKNYIQGYMCWLNGWIDECCSMLISLV